MPGVATPTDAAEAASAATKSKRVRTGCLTCRERHLKCDEALPHCRNCRKSSRQCKRGVRLNFIDTTVRSPPVLTRTADYQVHFQDESRIIASEYQGGLGRYALATPNPTPPLEARTQYPALARPTTMMIDPRIHDDENIALALALPPIQSRGPSGPSARPDHARHGAHRHHSLAASDGTDAHPPSSATFGSLEQTLTPPNETRDYLNSPEEVLLMQVFVEEVGLWMDSMDPLKHFSRLLPFHALGEPMLLHAFLACGARHLTLVNPMYPEDTALYYDDTATTQLLRALQNPDRDTVICATTAVILNVYEIMSERAMQRMNHIAGARALIKECGWNAQSRGIGAACFWLNVGMELLSCLHFNWQVAWEPDQWGLDMDFRRETESGREEIWVHRMLYIVGKVANFRASIPRFQEASPHDEQLRLQARLAEWQRLKALCEDWNASIPRTMHPMGYLYPSQTSSKSAFPEVWLIKRATIVGRLFYHTALCLIYQTNPLLPASDPTMLDAQLSHAHHICGITAHIKDRGVASVAIRSLAIAAEALVVRREQDEVLVIFEKIMKETGWKVGFLLKELRAKWGWERDGGGGPGGGGAAGAGAGAGAGQAQPGGAANGSGGSAASLAPFFASASSVASHGQGQSQSQSQSQSQGQSQGQSQSQSQTGVPPPPQPQTQHQPPPPPQTHTQTQSRPGLMQGILNPLLAKADFSLPNHPYQQYYQPPSGVGSGVGSGLNGIGLGSGLGSASGLGTAGNAWL